MTKTTNNYNYNNYVNSNGDGGDDDDDFNGDDDVDDQNDTRTILSETVTRSLPEKNRDGFAKKVFAVQNEDVLRFVTSDLWQILNPW